jgi:HEAT repeat protein
VNRAIGSRRWVLVVALTLFSAGCPKAKPAAPPASPSEAATPAPSTEGSAKGQEAPPSAPAEVTHEGRSLSAWTKELLGAKNASPRERMKDKASIKAWGAFVAMGSKASPAAPALLEALVGSDRGQANVAGNALALLGSKTVVPLLCEAMDSASVEDQRKLVSILVRVVVKDGSQKTVLEVSHKLLAASDNTVRNNVVFLLSAPPADAALAKAIVAAHRERPLRGGVIDVLAKMGPAALPALLEWLEGDGRKQPGGLVDLAIGKLSAKAIPALLVALKDTGSAVTRLRLLFALSSVASKHRRAPQLVPLVEASLEIARGPHDLNVRVAALVVVGRSAASPEASKLALPGLTQLLADEVFGVAGAAARALVPFGARAASACPQLIALMERLGKSKTSYAGTEAAVIEALGAIGPQASAAVPLLKKLGQSSLHTRKVQGALRKIQR